MTQQQIKDLLNQIETQLTFFDEQALRETLAALHQCIGVIQAISFAQSERNKKKP